MYFNDYQQFYRNYYNQNIPIPKTILYPRFTNQIRKTNTLNLSKIIDTTQRSINTINKIVPLYKQVTPIVKQISSFSKSLGSFIFKTPNNMRQDNNTNPLKEDYRERETQSKIFYK